ncbi:MAG: Hpt domain-containing protein [Candidatus Neomarinimicrobiota bacterium]
MSKSDIIDAQAIAQLKKIGGESLLREILGLFAKTAPVKVQDALRANEQGDLKQVERAVHSLKSSVGNLGAFQLMEICGRIEALAGEGKADQVSALLDELTEAHNQVATRLQSIRQTLDQAG